MSSAWRDRRGVGAFNVISLGHAEAVVAGTEAAGCPVICQISENAVRFHGSRLAPIARATAALAEAATVSVALHLEGPCASRTAVLRVLPMPLPATPRPRRGLLRESCSRVRSGGAFDCRTSRCSGR
ncbi:class II fructose-bisphosphate aldolase [Streptomyces sp. NBC_01549]|uniref:class II fructose-bisphosphate aldolase n=1 Tax=Streptomyces sp. NBC_01549 TaxID=2975874 RepID=UPI002B1CB60F|nr:class II fructose-bisphosphate aldolase [Streptomyces sp. NBC_01549]